MAIDSAWRRARLRRCCSGVSPLPTTGSSQLNPRYQFWGSMLRGNRIPRASNRRRTSSESFASARKSGPQSDRSISGTSKKPWVNLDRNGVLSFSMLNTSVSRNGSRLPQSASSPASRSPGAPSQG